MSKIMKIVTQWEPQDKVPRDSCTRSRIKRGWGWVAVYKINIRLLFYFSHRFFGGGKEGGGGGGWGLM